MTEELKKGIPKPKQINTFEITDNQKKEYRNELESLMRQSGILKKNEHLEHPI